MRLEDHGKCCLCGLPYDQRGNNPWPLAHGEEDRCCSPCDQVVIEARIDPAGMDMEIRRVEDAMLRIGPDQLRRAAIAAICASRGPVLWAQRQRERAQFMAGLDEAG
jgi:hypothetical protein